MSVSESVDKVYNESALGFELRFNVMRKEDVEFKYLKQPNVSTDAEQLNYWHHINTLINYAYFAQFILTDRDGHRARLNSTDRVGITEKMHRYAGVRQTYNHVS